MIQYIAKASDSLMDTVWNLNEVVSIQTNKNIQNAEISLRDYIEKATRRSEEKFRNIRFKFNLSSL